MTEINFTINLQIRFEDVPEEIVTAFTKDLKELTDLNNQRTLDSQVENVLETFLRDYYMSFFDGTTYDQLVKDLFRETSGAAPTAKIESCEVV